MQAAPGSHEWYKWCAEQREARYAAIEAKDGFWTMILQKMYDSAEEFFMPGGILDNVILAMAPIAIAAEASPLASEATMRMRARNNVNQLRPEWGETPRERFMDPLPKVGKPDIINRYQWQNRPFSPARAEAVAPDGGKLRFSEMNPQQRLETSLNSKRLVGPESSPLKIGDRRPVVFDTKTGTMHYSESMTQRHISIVERAKLPLEDGRFVGGEIEALEDGSLRFRPISGTFPVGEVAAESGFLPQRIYDNIRGVTTGLSISE